MRKGTEKELKMKTFSEIQYKPKPEFFDQFLNELLKPEEDIGNNYYIIVRDDEIFQFWIFGGIAEISEMQVLGLEWLDAHRHMLQEYKGHGHTKSWTGFVYRDPNDLQ